jgi:hypothetical protein
MIQIALDAYLIFMTEPVWSHLPLQELPDCRVVVGLHSQFNGGHPLIHAIALHLLPA